MKVPVAKKPKDGALELAGATPGPGTLLDAAREVFGERGFSGARITDAMPGPCAGSATPGSGLRGRRK